MQGANKGIIRTFTGAVLVTALVLLTSPAFAQCSEGDTDCPLSPPISQEVSLNEARGSLGWNDPEVGTTLPALHVEMPFQAASSLSTQYDLGQDKAGPPLVSIAHWDVPLRMQEPGDVSCGVQALGMAMDGLRDLSAPGLVPTSQALLDFLESEGLMYEFGTGVEELAHAARAFGYESSEPFHNRTVEDLRGAVSVGMPVVVTLGESRSDRTGHFVTITGFSVDGKWIAYNDPIVGRVVRPTREFERAWEIQGRSGVVLNPEVVREPGPGVTPLIAAIAALMGLTVLTPSVLQTFTNLGTRRKGIGGALVETGGMNEGSPPHPAPVGKVWVQVSSAHYENLERQVTENVEVPNELYKKVVVGTDVWYDRVPRYKTITVDEGRWVRVPVTKYRTKRYVRYYKTYRVRKKKYRYVRGRRRFAGYRYVTKRKPVYGTRKVRYTAYETRWKPKLVTKKVQDGFRLVRQEKPVYNWRWVVEGTKKVPITKTITKRVFVPAEWKLVEANAPEKDGVSDPPMEMDPTEEISILKRMARGLYDHPMLVDGSQVEALKIRSDAGMEFDVLTYAAKYDQVVWSGRTKYADGAKWYEITYEDVHKGTVRGWVSGKYLMELPVQKRISNTSSTRSTLDYWIALYLEYFYQRYLVLTPEERRIILDEAKESIEKLWREIEAVLAASLPPPVNTGLHGLVEEADTHEYGRWRQRVMALLEQPSWYKNGGMPPTYIGPMELSKELRRNLQALLLNTDYVPAGVSEALWKIVAGALGYKTPDLKLQVLETISESWSRTRSVGDLPVMLYVTDPDGVRLREFPTEECPNISTAFGGIPFLSNVLWDGGYHVGTDADGRRRVYYHVTFGWKDKEYTGWVPVEFVHPENVEIIHHTPEEKLEGPFPANTYGYGEEDGWAAYHAGGAAQNLDLRRIFEIIGDEDFNSYSTNHPTLCGLLAAMQAMNVSLERGFQVFADEVSKDFLRGRNGDERYPYSGVDTELRPFFEALGWTADVQKGSQDQLSFSSAANSDNVAVLALVSINPNNGELTQGNGTAHWVRVVDIPEEGDVVVYNPYTNDTESYSWDEFHPTWSSTPGNQSNYLYIKAERPK